MNLALFIGMYWNALWIQMAFKTSIAVTFVLCCTPKNIGSILTTCWIQLNSGTNIGPLAHCNGWLPLATLLHHYIISVNATVKRTWSLIMLSHYPISTASNMVRCLWENQTCRSNDPERQSRDPGTLTNPSLSVPAHPPHTRLTQCGNGRWAHSLLRGLP